MSWLDALLGRIHNAGVEVSLGKGLNFLAGLSASLNASTKMIDVSVTDGSLGAVKLAAPAAGVGVPFVIGPVAFTAAIAGPIDDAVLLSAPYALKILDVTLHLSANYPGETAQLRSATGGGGSALSSALSTTSTGTVRNNDTGTRNVVAGGDIYLRRSVNMPAGEVWILAVRT